MDRQAPIGGGSIRAPSDRAGLQLGERTVVAEPDHHLPEQRVHDAIGVLGGLDRSFRRGHQQRVNPDPFPHRR